MIDRRALACIVGLTIAFAGCGGAAANTRPRKGQLQRGKASWYGKKWHGRKTASGEPFDRRKLTAAHKRLPFGTIVRVTNLRNRRSVRVRINDRGPYIKGRIIDVSEAAARRLKMLRAGVVPVKIEIIRVPRRKPRRKPRRRRRR